uniref:Sperm-associated antigen 17 n=1 Tax=Panagrellus redivivus TaxID=6233 RepID=A0A7E4VRF0_PANRE
MLSNMEPNLSVTAVVTNQAFVDVKILYKNKQPDQLRGPVDRLRTNWLNKLCYSWETKAYMYPEVPMDVKVYKMGDAIKTKHMNKAHVSPQVPFPYGKAPVKIVETVPPNEALLVFFKILGLGIRRPDLPFYKVVFDDKTTDLFRPNRYFPAEYLFVRPY